MATLLSSATGNWTAAGTWSLVDAGTYLNSEANSTVISTTPLDSSAFSFDGITIDGIAVKVANRAASPAGTITCTLRNTTDSTDERSLAINVSDIDSATISHHGWYFFKFSSTFTGVAGKLYRVRMVCSNTGSQVTLYRDSTSNNWSRMLRTTTNQAPAAGDIMWGAGEWTAAATQTTFVITGDETAATDYGTASTATSTPAIGICKGSELKSGTTAATAYILKSSGIINVYSGGILTTGESGAEMPRDSSLDIQFDCASIGDFGLRILDNAIWNSAGLSRTSGKNIVKCFLNTDEAAAQTTLGVDTDTGWLSGDVIGIGTTSRTRAECETRVLNGNAGASSMDVTAGLTYAHSGTSPTQAEVVLITRNVKIRSLSTTSCAYVYISPKATVNCTWTQFSSIGGTAAGKRGVEIVTNTGSVDMQYCSFDTSVGHQIYMPNADTANVNFDHNVTYNTNSTAAAGNRLIYIAASSSASTLTFDDNVFMLHGGSSVAVFLDEVFITFTNARFAGTGQNAFQFNEASALLGTFSDINIHGLSGSGINFQVHMGNSTISNLTIWRCGASSIYITAGLSNFIFDTATLFGSVTAITTAEGLTNVTFKNVTSNGDTTFSTATGLNITNTGKSIDIIFDNCDFSTVSGIKTAHTNDVVIPVFTSPIPSFNILCRDTKLPTISGLTNIAQAKSGILYERYGQTAGDHRAYYRYKTIQTDGTVYNTAAPSEKITPSTASFKQTSGSKTRAVVSGGTVTVSVYVWKSATYNGAQPRLIVKANPAIGIDSDTVLDTVTVAVANWEQLTGTTAAASDDGTVEFVVDCDGTAGYINVDDWAVTADPIETGGQAIWFEGLPVQSIETPPGASGLTSYIS